MKCENATAYKVEGEVSSKLKSLVKEVETLCVENKIPFFFSAAIENNAEGTKYMNITRSGEPMGVLLADEQIITHEKVCRGFAVIMPEMMADITL